MEFQESKNGIISFRISFRASLITRRFRITILKFGESKNGLQASEHLSIMIASLIAGRFKINFLKDEE